jgi:hypothetical protein
VGANLQRADLWRANLDGADLREAKLWEASLVHTNVEGCNLNGCRIYGISVWDLEGEPMAQKNLVITPSGNAEITVDDLEVAQFIYLLLNNQKIRNVLDTITSKGVLILGRFYEERKGVLDAIKDKLRDKGYLPILFDFENSENRDLTETIMTLAGMCRFVIADITDAKSIPQELKSIVPNFPSVPIKPILAESFREYAMFGHFTRFDWVLDTYFYPSEEVLIENLDNMVISPSEAKWEEMNKTIKKGPDDAEPV